MDQELRQYLEAMAGRLESRMEGMVTLLTGAAVGISAVD
jgi:hypothetical protein